MYDADGNKIGGEYLVNSQPGSNQYYPTVAGLADGSFVITWQDFSQALGDNSAYGITAQIFNLADAPNAPTPSSRSRTTFSPRLALSLTAPAPMTAI